VLLLLYAVADHRGGISGDGFGQREYHGNGGSSTKGGGRGQVDYGQLREEVRDVSDGVLRYRSGLKVPVSNSWCASADTSVLTALQTWVRGIHEVCLSCGKST
jgi:hypothetical protein